MPAFENLHNHGLFISNEMMCPHSFRLMIYFDTKGGELLKSFFGQPVNSPILLSYGTVADLLYYTHAQQLNHVH